MKSMYKETKGWSKEFRLALFEENMEEATNSSSNDGRKRAAADDEKRRR